ncbi:MAG TPA: hypothetical protein VM364_00625 [Vicinamibacterales bacterium]|nr:hypothetical protein [Vicinamibacterales bacterium]
MTSEQLQALARLTASTRDVVAQLRVIAHAAPAAAAATEIGQTLAQLQAEVALLADAVQETHARTWLNTNPPRPPAPVTSADLPHGVHVRKFDPNGRATTEANSAAPALSGRWQIGTLGRPKPRSRSAEAGCQER